MSRLNILIVDDNRDLADGLGMILEDEGYQVTLAYNGHDGIRAFDNGHFDLALVDYKLPNMNGVAMLQEIHKKDPKVQTIMMTGYHIEQLLADVIDDGDVEVLRKPFEIGSVLDILAQMHDENVILIAEDDPGFGDYLNAYLTDHGISSMLVCNHEEAVQSVNSGSIDVLVLDFRVPLINVLEVFLELKQQGLSVKSIIITGCADEKRGTIDILRSTAVTGCLFKPFRPESLLHEISRITAA